MGRLLGAVFNVVTFPGVLLRNALQTAADGYFLPPLDELDVPGLQQEHRAEAVAEGDAEAGASGQFETETRSDPAADSDWTVGVDEAKQPTAGDIWGSVPYTALLASTFVPFVAASAIAAVLFLVSKTVLDGSTIGFVLWWVGMSAAVHAFPSQPAAQALWTGSLNANTPLRFLGLPLAGLSRLALLLQILWLDLIYGVALYLVVVTTVVP